MEDLARLKIGCRSQKVVSACNLLMAEKIHFIALFLLIIPTSFLSLLIIPTSFQAPLPHDAWEGLV